MDKLKLKWKIFAFLLGFSALLLVILWFFQTVLLTDMYKIIRKGQIEKAITLVGENINSPNLQTVLNNLEADKEIIVKQMQEFTPPQRPWQDDRGRPQPETITKTKAFTLQDDSTVSLTFFAMVTPVDATVSTLQMQLYIITGIMLILSTVIAMIIAKKVSKPIENINKSAKLLAAGRYDTNFYGQGFLEIKELSDTLNTASSELSKVECLRRELMANISHDLRTPLALIYSYAEMMHDFPTEITPEQTQIIMDETNRLASLVNDVLDVSRLETGTMELSCQPYNLTKSIAITLDRMVELVKKDGYSISFEHTEDLYVTADEVKITQAFYNLLINALHYSGDNKKITVRQNNFDGWVKIQVIDNGEGIDSENLPYIWDRYYKVDKKHKRAIIGTGLGLSIVKKIIDLHGGNYGVESQVGSGSTFWFTIKLNK
ncbi:MAG: HAMP domain-containing sensor histidine kinase [Clostridium sp.]|uniref:sensor histidine kinase n=1 Tax=Clostridium sp. TaxID=1506 RepID=UPI0030283696